MSRMGLGREENRFGGFCAFPLSVHLEPMSLGTSRELVGTLVGSPSGPLLMQCRDLYLFGKTILVVKKRFGLLFGSSSQEASS